MSRKIICQVDLLNIYVVMNEYQNGMKSLPKNINEFNHIDPVS